MEKYSRVRPGTDGNIIRRMRFFSLDNEDKNTDTLRMFNNYCFPTATMNKRKCLNVTLNEKWPSLSPSSAELSELLTIQLISYAYVTYAEMC